MNKKEFETIINKTVPSRQMREFLCLPESGLSRLEFADVIIGSPEITINEKYDLLCLLADEYGEEKIAEYARDFKAAIDNLACAPGELFTVDDPWYDEDIKEVKYSGFSNQLCADYNIVIGYIDWKYKYEEYESDNCTWFVIKKWAPDENSRYINTYIYYFIYGIGICWFAACREYRDEGPYSRLPKHKYSSACTDLNIATPFRAGDIVRIDCRPFAPPVNALILYAGPDWDCCSLLALYRDDKGDSLKWNAFKGLSKLEFERLILQERLREFCFEGRRWYDLLRYNYRHMSGVNYNTLMVDLGDNQAKNYDGFLTLMARKYTNRNGSALVANVKTEPYLYLPVLKSEVEINNLLKQNPAYKDRATAERK